MNANNAATKWKYLTVEPAILTDKLSTVEQIINIKNKNKYKCLIFINIIYTD